MQPQALFENLEITAQLTRCSTNPLTLKFCCHGNDSPGRCVHILIRKRNEISNLCGWGSSLLSVSSLSPYISQLRKAESFKMPFYYVWCGAHHVCGVFSVAYHVCSDLAWEERERILYLGEAMKLKSALISSIHDFIHLLLRRTLHLPFLMLMAINN